ncbi:HipA family kinase [Streptomyces sp. NPDC058045]|uniref:HipA family kinase n=1 Tax=Streptomyces sp. NPDC058045 TaxID=3346311 RepID=UPI0036E5EEB6
MLREVTAGRYVEPLTAGGSVPGVVEADDLGTYVVKFTGSAQGRKALVAEVIVGELARRLGLRVPELVRVRFDPAVAADEPHQEVQDLLRASAGLNLGMDLLPGARDFTPEVARDFTVDPVEAGRVVWLDALTANVDRTVHSSNLMVWPVSASREPRLWLIDHGAALVFHHRWDAHAPRAAAGKRYDFRHHALGGFAPDTRAADAELAPRVTGELLREVVALVPDEWLPAEASFAGPDELREAYAQHLEARARVSAEWLPTDFPSRAELIAEDARRAEARRAGRPGWLKRVPDLHGRPAAAPDWSAHLE